jgi:peroxiredoxin
VPSTACTVPTGAYTSICSSKHVPEYNKRADELMQQGVDRIICLSVNGELAV